MMAVGSRSGSAMTGAGPRRRPASPPAALLAAALCASSIPPGFAACTPEIGTSMAAEADRIGECLDWIAARPADPADVPEGRHAERLLYTWGPQVKIDRMLEDPFFCDYEFARQAEFEYGSYLALPTDQRFWGGRSPLRSMSQLDAALTANRPPRSPARYTDEELKGRSIQFALLGLRDPGLSAAQRRGRIEQEAQEFEGLAFSMKKARADGRLAAIAMIDAAAAGDGALRPSSIKGGLGVYFSADPFRYFDAATRAAGLVCRTPEQRVIVDRSRQATNDFLVEHAITLRGRTLEVPGAKLVPTIENPALFDRAARGRHIVRLPAAVSGAAGRQSAYVDKCVLPYRNRGVCGPLTIEQDWLACEDFTRLLGLQRNPSKGRLVNRQDLVAATADPDAANAAMHAYLARPTHYRDYAATFRARFSQCYGLPWKDQYKALLQRNGRATLIEGL